MANKKGSKPAPSKGKGKTKKPSYVYGSSFEVSGDSLKRKNKSCPKCGTGYFLAAHKDRMSCGKCGYMEKVRKEAPKE